MRTVARSFERKARYCSTAQRRTQHSMFDGPSRVTILTIDTCSPFVTGDSQRARPARPCPLVFALRLDLALRLSKSADLRRLASGVRGLFALDGALASCLGRLLGGYWARPERPRTSSVAASVVLACADDDPHGPSYLDVEVGRGTRACNLFIFMPLGCGCTVLRVVACVQSALVWGLCGGSVFTITLTSCHEAVRKLTTVSGRVSAWAVLSSES